MAMRFLLPVMLAALFSNAGSQHQATAAEEDVQITPDVVYGHKDGMALTFDILRPSQPHGAVILHLQSGGWYSGWSEPRNRLKSSEPFLKEGFTVLIVRHGSAPRYQVPDAVADVRLCIRYLHRHAASLKIDPARLGVWGGSAGGHLTLMLATTGDDGDPAAKDETLKFPSRIAAGVALYPPTDLRGWTTDPPAEIAAVPTLKPPLAFAPELEPSVSPIVQVSSDDAPVLMIHGDLDKLVPIEHSQKLLPVLEAAKVPGELITVKGAAHGYSPEQNSTIVVPGMLRWFNTYLRQPKSPGE